MPSLNLNFGRRSGPDLVGLDIQPGFVAAVQARVNGSVLAERASALPLAADTVRDGEVTDVAALSDALRELFAGSGLSKRVRIGVANQRTVLRTLELPPVTDRKELAAAVSFQAQDQVPMPLNNAVLDFHPLGVIDTPSGPRQRVVLVAAQRDMIERLLAAVRGAGLRPEGIDLSAFALIRSLYRSDPEGASRVLYLNVDGLTNLAIAEDHVCRFTRVVGSGLEGMASEIAERRGIALTEARELLSAVDLNAPEEAPSDAGAGVVEDAEPDATTDEQSPEGEPGESPEDHEAREREMTYEEMMSGAQPAAAEQTAATPAPDQDVRAVLERGIHDIAGEVRNSLDFHRSQDGGGEVSRIVLSGSALDLPGFAEALQSHLRVEVHAQTVGLADDSLTGTVSTHRLAIAAGLAATEIAK
ncbi:MAG TPA: type IV pilus assembly protein PilM [Solirubrobacteraceae bacterium]|nr:type IV pilus assembly protein PilM [Solirubrobacteraceae bacterium]